MLVIDPWLLDLGAGGRNRAAVAAVLGRTQHRTFKRLGHIMNFGDEAARGRISAASEFGRVCDEPIFCLRCGAGAMLSAWVQSDNLAQTSEFGYEGLGQRSEALLAVAFRLPCEGSRVARVAAEYFAPYLVGEGQEPCK